MTSSQITCTALTDRRQSWFNPLVLGGVSSTNCPIVSAACPYDVSIPSSSGRSLQHREDVVLLDQLFRLNPLFIGEVSSTMNIGIDKSGDVVSQSPLHRGGLFNEKEQST